MDKIISMIDLKRKATFEFKKISNAYYSLNRDTSSKFFKELKKSCDSSLFKEFYDSTWFHPNKKDFAVDYLNFLGRKIGNLAIEINQNNYEKGGS